MVYDKIWTRLIPKTISTCILTQQNRLVIPNKALTNYELLKYAYCLKIPHFRGVFMVDAMPKYPWKDEAAVVNLDKSDGPGTHWVCYKKFGNTVYYFDSFGNLPPPLELQFYFRKIDKVLYNVNREQDWDTNVCGHLCLEFLASTVSDI